MNILLVGFNYASVMSTYSKTLETMGYNTKAIEFDSKKNMYRSYDKVDYFYLIENIVSIIGIFRLLKFFVLIFRTFSNADVIHVFSDFRVVKSKRINSLLFRLIFDYIHPKNNYITFLGSEVRDPQMELRLNKFYKYVYFDKQYEYSHSEKEQNSLEIQKKFSRFKLICSPETFRYIRNGLFETIFLNHLPSALNINFSRKNENSTLKILHAPTATIAKGTKYILEAIRILEKENITGFEFELVSNLSNDEFLNKLSETDIYIDQLIWGWYGIAAQQAMELGVVVIANISDDRKGFIDDSSILNADINNIYDVILKVLRMTPEQLNLLKEQSRAFYINHHQAKKILKNSIKFYLSQ